MGVAAGQLALDLEPAADLDLDCARELFEAEAARTSTAPSCRCLRRSMCAITTDGDLVCLKCGRRWR